MQTFLPYASYWRSAQVLDRQRLGKQRVEAMQILQIIMGEAKSDAWGKHPAVKMWEDYPYQLMLYLRACNAQWKQRGYRSVKTDQFIHRVMLEWTRAGIPGNQLLPWWFGDHRFHESHRSNLLRKSPAHYGRFGWDVPMDLPYVWPTAAGGWNVGEKPTVNTEEGGLV